MEQPRGLDLTSFDRYLAERGIAYEDKDRSPIAFEQWMALETGHQVAGRPSESEPDSPT